MNSEIVIAILTPIVVILAIVIAGYSGDKKK